MIPKCNQAVSCWVWRSTRKLFLLLSVLLLHVAHLEGKKDNQFIWKAGPWGRCSGDCGVGGVQSRAVWCFHVEGWTSPLSHCEEGSKPPRERSCFRVCDWHRELFQWEVSDWHHCVLVPYAQGEVKARAQDCVMAQHGLQHRTVRCLQKLNGTVVASHICEHFAPPPPTEQACLIPCPRDCVVSEFSPWSKCSQGCGKNLQHRTRVAMAPPLYGGLPCPNLTESRACDVPISCPLGEEEHTFSLKVGPWSKCRLPHLKEVNLNGRTALGFSSESKEEVAFKHLSYKAHHHSQPWDVEIGYQTRQVWCTRSDGRNALLSLCIQDSFPLTVKPCIMPKDCETSQWSSWSPCSKTCRSGTLSPGVRSRSRNVKHVAIGGGQECPELLEKEACIVEQLQPCPRYSWRTSEWSECQVSLLLEQQDLHWHETGPVCGGGIQTREVYCAESLPISTSQRTKEVLRPVENTLCFGPAPLASQLCSVPCSTDCIVSSWSAWGQCTYENCQDPQGRKGFRMRQRHVLMESTGPIGRCPHLVESVPCEDPMCYRWLVSEGNCVADHGKCGQGHRILKAVCQDGKGEDVSGSFCSVPPPPERMACEIPCRMDCVISEWTMWSSCSQSCSNKNSDGKQTRSRYILALAGEGGKPCPHSQVLQEYRLCNDHSCVQLYWETSPWGLCSENTLVTTLNATIGWNGEATCGVGIQTRKVFCVKSHVGQVMTKRCPDSTRPETVRPCFLPCKKDCIVTAFSEWTSCPRLCQPGNATIKQSRYRIIIQEAANGGQECPDTLFEERECEDIPVCPVYRWKLQKWSPCILVPESIRQGIMGTGEACGKGLQTRAVSCISDDNQSVEMMECLKQTNGMPDLVQECTVPCRGEECTLTPWSKFTPCSGSCEATQSRRRQLTGKSRKKEKCQDANLYPLVETQFCPCDVFTSQPYGNWSDCILPEGKKEVQRGGFRVQGDNKECGEGIHFRAIACSDKNGRLVDPSYCNSSGYIEEECNIPCPFDCKLSDWSSWGPCSSSCGIGVRIRSKWLKEKPYNRGRPCPKLDLKNQVHEAVPCYTECNRYSWVVEPWSPCKINNELRSPRCGRGIQSRKVRCVNTANSEGESVDTSLCKEDEAPPETQSCSLLCSSDCVMSEWGTWTTCPQSCDPHTMQRRTRHLLRPLLSSRTCAEDSQVRPCLLNENCFQFQYNLTEWSTCQLSENASCGQGVRTRLLSCVRSDGKLVSMDQCEQLNLEKPQRVSLPCLVECVVNCQLSGWTAWTECSQTCGQGGRMTRTRFIIMPTQGEGRPCPTELTQQKTCPVTPCYSWVLGNWSACKLEGGECGEGIQVRSFSCVVHSGSISHGTVPVKDTLCGEMPFQDNILKQPCSLPCPGDCHLTPWSEWSKCELTCIDGRSFEAMGRQSRSRTFIIQSFENQDSCPQQVLETRPCTGGKCYHYIWKTSLWNNNERTVWCQRSDGVNVTGGCAPQARPAAIRQCIPACKKPFSYCTQGGVCGCEEGYTEIMRSNGFLDYCMKIPGSEDRKADVKNLSGKNRPVNSKIHDIFKGWSLQLLDPDGRVKIWVYGISGGGFLIMIFLVFTSYFVCKKPKAHQSTPPHQKPLTLAYDGDVDM